MRVKFMLFSIERAENINRKFLWIGEKLSKVFSNLKYDLQKADIDLEADKYLTAAFFSALIYGLLFFWLLFGLTFVRDGAIIKENLVLSFFIGLIFFFVFFFLLIIYPRIMAKNIALGIDQSLIFGLKSILIQVTSGISLYEAMVNVSNSNYGLVSKEFKRVINEISAGESETKALERLALNTKSEYLKKTCWQLITSMRSGASLVGALQSVVETLNNLQVRAIKNYAAELNLWILVYLLVAAAVPTLGITFMVILSTMGGSSIGQEHILFMVFVAVFVQIVLIGFVRSRIPKGYI